MENITAGATGKVIGFKNNGIIAILETEDGEVYIDVNTDLLPSLRVGDSIEIETESYYISNGRFVYMVSEDTHLAINGWIGKWKKQKS